MKRVLKACWQGSRFCTHCLLSFGLWTLWLLLGILLAVQVFVATSRELAVPRFVLRELSSRFTASGLRVEFDRARFDPSGRLFVEGVRVVSLSFNEPLLTADSFYLRLDPWNLLLREVDLDEIEASGVDLHVPAMLSPTGRGEPVVRNVHALLHFDDEKSVLLLPSVDARFADLTVVASGAIAIPPSRPGELPVLEEIVRHYLKAARQAAFLASELEAFSLPSLEIELTPDAETLARASIRLRAEEVSVPAGRFGLPEAARIDWFEARTTAPLRFEHVPAPEIEFSARRISLGKSGEASSIDALLKLEAVSRTLPAKPRDLIFSAAAVRVAEFAAGPVTVSLASTGEGRATARLDTSLHGESWTATSDFDFRTKSGTARAEGRLPRGLFETVARRFDERLNTLVSYDEAPFLAASVQFAPGGKVSSAEARLETGPVVARNVALAGVKAHLAWSGDDVRVDDIELRTHGSVAHGSYTMDTKTRDFRFLLKGSLQPSDIDGWFRDWWPRFWSVFDFARSTPTADVEVAGRWGLPHLTRVFVRADSGPAGLRGVAMDKIHTRIFVRPGFVDALRFEGERDGRHARGRFTHVQDLDEREMERVDFDIEGDLPAKEAARLAGPAVVALTEPYRFTAPPSVKVAGRVYDTDTPEGKKADLRIEGSTDQPMTFHGFPLSSLSFKADVKGEHVNVSDVVAGFAEGVVRGRGKLSGPSDDRRLAFDGKLDDATLGLAIRTIEEFGARRAGVPPPPQSRFQQRIASGHLDLTLSAEGRPDDLHSFRGSGTALISQADLGEINLLGILSTLLRRTLLNYSTLQLDTARASFDVDREKLVFSKIRVTGPRAAIDASGTYDLGAKNLDFLTKVHPFEESRGLLGSALGTVLAPLSAVMEVKLTGRLENPSWAFVYGPTSLFRAITGSEPSGSQPAPEENENPADSDNAK